MNYFKLFNIPEKFNINKKILTKNFYKLQLQFHPDLFINDSLSKKKIILNKSIEINKGYKTLKDSLSRAIYLLFLNGFKVSKETILLKNHNFLIKYFSLYEELEYLKNNRNEKKIDIFLKKIEKKIDNYEIIIDMEFKNKNYEKVMQVIAKLLFFKKIKIHLKKE
ncbi:Fe-S protein assembly co-chaperone HscB [Buchnera aphidicola]|uniref:Fe-S protein assembly co-chaperone HscB n=1 Tax=Buchnera aphidicola TaxID=9 RepID=UPI003464792D